MGPGSAVLPCSENERTARPADALASLSMRVGNYSGFAGADQRANRVAAAVRPVRRRRQPGESAGGPLALQVCQDARAGEACTARRGFIKVGPDATCLAASPGASSVSSPSTGNAGWPIQYVSLCTLLSLYLHNSGER